MNPVPENMTYIDKSAEGKGARIDYSVDGGKTYGAADKLTSRMVRAGCGRRWQRTIRISGGPERAPGPGREGQRLVPGAGEVAGRYQRPAAAGSRPARGDNR